MLFWFFDRHSFSVKQTVKKLAFFYLSILCVKKTRSFLQVVIEFVPGVTRDIFLLYYYKV